MAKAQIPLVLFFLLQFCRSQETLPYQVIFEWKDLDFQFPTPEERTQALESGRFIPENNVASGVKVGADRVFVAVPRWRPGVPSTLNYIPFSGQEQQGGPALIPYPSWEMQQEGNCSCIQFTMAVELDQFDRMWVMDTGRRNILEMPHDDTCPPKLMLIDMKTDQVILTHEFPAEVVSRNGSFLNDIVVGCTSKDECMAYMSDAFGIAIVAFDLVKNKSWFVKHKSMLAEPEAIVLDIKGVKYDLEFGIDGIALANQGKNFDTIYYSPISTHHLWSVNAEVIKAVGTTDVPGLDLLDSDIVDHGLRPAQVDGMTMDANSVLYYGLLGKNSVGAWDLNKKGEEGQWMLATDDNVMEWADSFSISPDGYLYFTLSNIHKYVTKTFKPDEVKYRICRVFINAPSYMYPTKTFP